jgi:hypothetical protein
MQVRRIEKLEEFWHARTMAWEEALCLANGILASCAKRCDEVTAGVIAEEFSAILRRFQRGEIRLCIPRRKNLATPYHQKIGPEIQSRGLLGKRWTT